MRRCLSLAVFSAAFAVGAGLAAAARADDGARSDDLFKKLDTNGDGKLTASEVPAEHRKFFERLLRIGDANKDGELSREEFEQALDKKDQPVTDINRVGGLGGGPGAGAPKFDPKRVFQALDKNHDGKLTRDEVENRPRIKALFDRLGKDELTVDDLSVLANGGGKKAGGKAKKKAKKGTTEASAAAARNRDGDSDPASAFDRSPLFRLLDANHDGRLSKEELAKAAEMFDQLDRNHDGFLDARELAGAPAASGSDEAGAAGPAAPGDSSRPLRRGGAAFGAAGRNRANLARLIKSYDVDGDGKLSMNEAPPMLKAHFAEIDTNSDGFLDKSEIEAAMKTMRRERKLGVSATEQNPAGQNPAGQNPAGQASSQPGGF